MLRSSAAVLAAVASMSLPLTVVTSCASPESAPSREERTRIKGVELYSWQNDAGDWTFALLDGTNWLKSEAEVRGAPERFVGIDALAAAFDRLAIVEFVSWSHHVHGFSYPDAALRTEIRDAAEAAGVELMGGPREPQQPPAQGD